MRSHIFLKLIGIFAIVIAVATLIMDFAITRSWERSLRSEIETSLRQKVSLFAERVDSEALPMQQIAVQVAKAANARATVIDQNGVVLADSEANPADMENHASRPEFSDALRGSFGSSTRHSHTVDIDFLYVAAPVKNGAVRLAYPLSEIAASLRRVHITLGKASLLTFLVALLISAIAAQSLSGRINRILNFADEIANANLSARLNDHSNDELGHVAFALNRTATKLQESFGEIDTSRRELEAVLNSMQEAVIAVSKDMRVRWTNQRMERLLMGGVRRHQPLAESLRDPDFIAAVAATVETRSVHVSRAYSIAPGRVFNVTAAPMPSGGVVAVLYDLTDIERVEKTRRDFIANVSHELRTPLTSIQGYAETLLDAPASPEITNEFLEIIRKNASRMARLTEDLLVLAKVESGEKKLNLQPMAPAELLEDAAQYFRERQHESGMGLEVHAHALKLVSADRDAIFQVFTNLIDNACKYACEGKRVEIGAEDVEGGVQFYVRDFGNGISAEHLPRLFERFYRIDKARSRESGGTGLGLAIAKHVVRAHGGTIAATSEPGQETTFSFVLPEAREEV